MLALFRYIQIAQRCGLHLTTAYGAYRRNGGTASRSRFRYLWLLAEANPFEWNRSG